MIIDNLTIYFDNYRCFKERTQFGPIKRANVIIGKNNSGKSALIDAFTKLCASASSTTENDDMNFVIQRGLTSDEKHKALDVSSIFIKQRKRENPNYLDDIRVSFKKEGNKYSFQDSSDAQFHKIMGSIIAQNNIFSRYRVIRLNADRDIIPEKQKLDNSDWTIPSNGLGLTTLLQAILNWKGMKPELVEVDILNDFNKISKPEIDISRILTKSANSGDVWELFLEEVGKKAVALSQSGSGLKTILLVLVFVHVLPYIKEIKPALIVYAFEELENNLHPSIQRKLYDYIEEKSKELNFTYFISTHSTVALDYYYGIESASIFQVSRSDQGSTVTALTNNLEVSKLIDDLGQKASDLLQSNCIIWVEGPSDRIYINKWIELYSDGQVQENKHYSIMFYGGKLLSHLTFDPGMEESDIGAFIEMFKINRHSVVVIDSDKKNKQARINTTKERVKKEVDSCGNLCWITQGREIENYLSSRVLGKIIMPEYDNTFFDPYSNILVETPRITRNKKLKKSISKVSFASLIISEINKTDLDVLDLRKRLEEITYRIRRWNGV